MLQRKRHLGDVYPGVKLGESPLPSVETEKLTAAHVVQDEMELVVGLEGVLQVH